MNVGDLVQVNKFVQGAGDVRLVVGLTPWTRGAGCVNVLCQDGIRVCHPTNLTVLVSTVKPEAQSDEG